MTPAEKRAYNARAKRAQRAREAASGLAEVRGILAPPALHDAVRVGAAKLIKEHK
jgi:hypothetical protein